MKKRFSLILLLAIILVFGGCAYVHVKEPFDTDLDKTILGDKEGKSSYQSILWLIAWGDAGTAAARRDSQYCTGGGYHQLRAAGVGPAHACV